MGTYWRIALEYLKSSRITGIDRVKVWRYSEPLSYQRYYLLISCDRALVTVLYIVAVRECHLWRGGMRPNC